MDHSKAAAGRSSVECTGAAVAGQFAGRRIDFPVADMTNSQPAEETPARLVAQKPAFRQLRVNRLGQI